MGDTGHPEGHSTFNTPRRGRAPHSVFKPSSYHWLDKREPSEGAKSSTAPYQTLPSSVGPGEPEAGLQRRAEKAQPCLRYVIRRAVLS